MPRFEILCESALVGWSELELGDPPMGVAFGLFIPSPEYMSIKVQLIAATSGNTPAPPLVARVAGGPVLESSGGVYIADHSHEFGPEGIEVTVFGLAYPLYEALFPEHVAAYEKQFKNDG